MYNKYMFQVSPKTVKNSINIQKKTRDSRFELLRILCMILIIAHHISVHGGYTITSESSAFNTFIVNTLCCGGKIGVNIFVIISGYFLVTSKFSFSKLLKLVSMVLFYSLFFYFLFLCFDSSVKFDFRGFLLFLLPTSNSVYWFFSAYIIIYILFPFMNACVNNINKNQHLLLIVFLVFLQSIVPYFGFSFLSKVGWFLTLYIIGAFIRKYEIKLFNKNWANALIAVLLWVIIVLFNTLLDIKLWDKKNIICLACSIFFFVFFAGLKSAKNCKIINFISSTTFGIYLIHDHTLVRPFLWKKLLNCPFHFGLKHFWLFVICSIVLVFVVCFVIETIRMLIVKLIYKLIDGIKTKNQKKKESDSEEPTELKEKQA